MHPTNCLNCATLLTADDRYCPNCGQKTATHRLSMSHIWHDLNHALTHTDKGFFYTIGQLLVRPGIVAREYLAGKRKKYFNPFSMLVIILGVYLISNSIFKPFSQDVFTPANQQRPDWIKTESQKKKYALIMERRVKLNKFFNERTNLVLFVSTPFLAFIFWLFYRRRYNYAEHLSTLAYVNSFLSLLTIFLYSPLLYFLPHQLKFFVFVVMLLSHVVYVSYMYYGFLGYKSFGGYLKVFGVGLVAIVAWAAFSMGLGAFYVMRGIF